jgi:hypothetical protein
MTILLFILAAISALFLTHALPVILYRYPSLFERRSTSKMIEPERAALIAAVTRPMIDDRLYVSLTCKEPA